MRWLPQIVEATADDIARFGPNAARVRALLEFLPTISDDAAEVTADTSYRSWGDLVSASHVAEHAVRDAKRAAEVDNANSLARASIRGTPYDTAIYEYHGPEEALEGAVRATVASDLVTPETYRTLTNPLAVGRAVDLLRNRPRYQGTPFLDVVRQAAERGLIAGPRDVATVGRVAQVPDKVAQQEALDLILNYGMSPEEAIIAIRALR